MKSIKLTFFCLLLISSISILQAQDPELPAPSPLGTLSQKIGLATVSIEYSRPSVKGRTIFGNIVPYNEIWRTGANKSTQFSCDKAIMIHGQTLEAGTYALYTIPGENEWTVILNKDNEQWGAYAYNKEKDALRFTVKPVKNTFTETLTFGISNVTMSTADVQLYWENTLISFPIKHNYLSEAQDNIKASIKQAENTSGLYDASAEFYLDNNLDAKQALEWSKKSVAMSEKYWNLYTYSRALAATGDKKAAVESAERALKLAEEAKNAGMAESIKKSISEWKAM